MEGMNVDDETRDAVKSIVIVIDYLMSRAMGHGPDISTECNADSRLRALKTILADNDDE